LNAQATEGASIRWNVHNIRPQSYEPICDSFFSYVGRGSGAAHLVSASHDKHLRVYQVPHSPTDALRYAAQDQYSGNFNTRQVEAHAKGISALCALPQLNDLNSHEHQELATASKDGSIRLWKLSVGSANSSPEAEAGSLPNRFSANGRTFRHIIQIEDFDKVVSTQSQFLFRFIPVLSLKNNRTTN
jgi:WD40 repeat protein